ncbi:MAG: glycosyltransferase [Syntrophobacteraceae bacterium]|nr:glycosyltransferase [Desulfobacteraceae bacterium]
MRILTLNYEFPPVGGGGGRFCRDLCGELARLGHEIRVQTVHFRGLPRLETSCGYAVYRNRSLRRRPHTCSVPEMAAFLAANLLPSFRHALTWKPGVIHAHFAVPTGVLGWLLHRATGIPYIVSTQLGDVPGAIPHQTDRLFRWVKPFTRPIWKDAAVVTAPSEHIRLLAERAYDVPVKVLPNGVDLSKIRANPATNVPPRLVFAGRFNSQKNLAFLLDVLSGVTDLDWRLEMVGDGPEMDLLRGRANDHGFEERVRFHGWQPQEVVESIVGRSDILVMPSLSEGLPIVGLISLASGLAVVGSDVGGIAELVEEGRNGFLCRAGDAGAFENALRECLQPGGRLGRMKEESRRLASRYDIASVARSFEECLFEATITRM